eukprot:snap_masked-scaffold_5-processed-gene-6.28-mRNA-1 protein AED:1.00 eAED:1.00 QI:0/-1/0/0/-1/1/1/0/312
MIELKTPQRREGLQTLSRRDLQRLAKQHGVKANQKSKDLVEELLYNPSIKSEAVNVLERARNLPKISSPRIEEENKKNSVNVNNPRPPDSSRSYLKPARFLPRKSIKHEKYAQEKMEEEINELKIEGALLSPLIDLLSVLKIHGGSEGLYYGQVHSFFERGRNNSSLISSGGINRVICLATEKRIIQIMRTRNNSSIGDDKDIKLKISQMGEAFLKKEVNERKKKKKLSVDTLRKLMTEERRRRYEAGERKLRVEDLKPCETCITKFVNSDLSFSKIEVEEGWKRIESRSKKGRFYLYNAARRESRWEDDFE